MKISKRDAVSIVEVLKSHVSPVKVRKIVKSLVKVAAKRRSFKKGAASLVAALNQPEIVSKKKAA